jgi:hypothetical protein
MAASERDILRSELRWSVVVGGAVTVIVAAVLYAALAPLVRLWRLRRRRSGSIDLER